ncbi:MAG: hypothetical protein A2084_03660 [Tenericutes bacterium GWC2_39_45]|nr:MAG: hypothetical protein A2Y43_02570 [Tenericutes bacterium GWA2_38_26]OHE30176.1 MAG: hypothetical protein A2084_03660 [Tenericutes bacterium GWC2_39_45]OHE31385.1 MAG: hypothetical protein A2009_00830 [Tenericutes bacterium GWD2_38_27]OHE39977.1 MAG: hypothetical protein A2102_02120 [Tenericutes bacterium GWF2_38_8]HBG32871.1 hypothetical protein [Acholeplasmataceae bacterium]
MRLSTVLNVRKLRIRNRIFTLGVIITGMLSLAFAVVTFYGQNAGNFLMSVDQASRLRGIGLTTEEDSSVTESRLMSDPIKEARDITYTWLKLDEIDATDGNFVDVDHEYVAFTFYLKNSGSETVDISYYIRLTEIYNNLDLGIRVLVIQDGEQSMYMKEDIVAPGTEPPYYPEAMPTAQFFLTERMVMRNTVTNLKPGDYVKFSVVVWLEGYDPDTTNDILGGMIKMEMNFTIDDDQS